MASADSIARRAAELTQAADRDAAVAELMSMAGHQRRPLEEAQAVFVARLHRRSDDFEATRALQLLHRALAAVGWQPTTASAVEPHRASALDRIARLLRTRPRPAAAEARSPQAAAA